MVQGRHGDSSIVASFWWHTNDIRTGAGRALGKIEIDYHVSDEHRLRAVPLLRSRPELPEGRRELASGLQDFQSAASCAAREPRSGGEKESSRVRERAKRYQRRGRYPQRSP